ncbi:MAG: zinc ribbon domain-containing protein [Oscillospiraceae bacterium]|jgi:hypothetical protein|nr:zinc ribbon domain-containing protein [Oscillospiraceae bacterium]
MTCLNCGAVLSDDAAACTQCGAAVPAPPQGDSAGSASMPARKCPTCGFSCREGSKYCDNCGQPLSAPPPSAAAPATNPASQWPYNIASNPFSMHQDSVVATSTYIKWMLLLMIPILGLVFAIIYAFDKKDLNRSNYFKAVLILQVAGLVLSILASVIFSIIGFSLFSNLSGFVTEYSNEGDSFFMSLAHCFI